jgi:DNA mismatch repair protein MutS2
MNPAVYRTLEFDRIREVLAREASTSLGRARALALEPAVDAGDVQGRLDLTREAVAFLGAGRRMALDAPEDLDDLLAELALDDEPLVPLRLLGLARFIGSVTATAAGVREHGTPGLRDVVAGVREFAAEIAGVTRAVMPSGDVSDDASPALRDIRDSLRRQRAKLRSTLEGLTRGRDTAKYLQDQIVTDRQGRYVLVVRAEHKDALPGIVHGSSASGASLYVEPLSTVELNNDVVALAEREKHEVYRILLALTSAFRVRRPDLDAITTAAADLDELFAKARLGARVDGTAPALAADGRIEFRGARHPLLIPAVRDLTEGSRLPSGERGPAPRVVVAADLVLIPPKRALVISGPNTGGKTVALKAFGLLSLMAQAGLLIPVDAGSAFTPFRSIFADIGDEQSIAASLSTFSAHVANLVAIERELEQPALVLLDEVGGGTDPVEGGALGAAVIDHFQRRGALVVATTHDDALKSYAATSAGASAAAFGFNPETYAPTYKLIYGAPGRSLALEIADRLGMPASVIADARARRTGRESVLAAHLARVDQELAAVEREKQRAQDDRHALAAERLALQARESRLAEREAVLKKRLDDKVTEKLREARAEVDAVVTRLKTKAATLAEQAERKGGTRGAGISTGDVGGIGAEARSALAAIGAAVEPREPAAEDAGALDAEPEIGQQVLVASFGTVGIVRGVSGGNADVEIRGKRMRVPLSGLRRTSKGGRDGDRPSAPRGAGPAVRSENALIPAASAELVVIGATVDVALERVEKFLDASILSDGRRLRIVHGHGTGRLRDAIRAFLKTHPIVATVGPAPDNEGGQGATIVELRD